MKCLSEVVFFEKEKYSVGLKKAHEHRHTNKMWNKDNAIKHIPKLLCGIYFSKSIIMLFLVPNQ